ncbi:MAG: DUF1738 domain-containing protein [Trueperaceae bacterium]|nr:DUF1738 domain-containing protein [Trueperaceae bacterium]
MPATTDATTRPQGPGRALYAEVLEGILAELQFGAVPWIPRWTDTGAAYPHNVVTKTRYSAFNVLLLWLCSKDAGFESNGWLTPKQVQQHGGEVKRGARPSFALKWFKAYTLVPAQSVEGAATSTTRPASGRRKAATGAGGSSASRGASALEVAQQSPGVELVPLYSALPAMTSFQLYNLDQVSGLPRRFYAAPPERPDDTTATMRLVRKARVALVHGGTEAFYSPHRDEITMPEIGAFRNESSYYATLLHEVVHWTGHPERLQRRPAAGSAMASYAAEELVAELGAAFLCAALGVKGEMRHAAYLEHWLKAARADPSYLFQAAMRAEQAVGYLEKTAKGCIPGARRPAATKRNPAGRRSKGVKREAQQRRRQHDRI